MFWLFKSQIIGAREVNNNKDARPGERERGREANSDISTRYPFLILHSSKRLPIDEENLPGPLMVPALAQGCPGATAPLMKTQFIKTSVICSERESATKGGASLSARQVAGDLALILSDMNNRFC